MADTRVGSAMISVADVAFFNTTSGVEIGQGIALTDSGIDSTMNNQEIRGGYLNPLLFNIMNTRAFNLTFTSATFKMLYLAFQSGTPIVSGNSNSYIFQECNTATNGAVTLQNTPSGYVHCILPSGLTVDVQSNGVNAINVGAGINGTVKCSYFTPKLGETITINTSAQPMVVHAHMRIHGKEQDGSKITYEVDIPLLQFTGEINFSLTADGVATQNINGSALAYTEDCGEPKYCTWTTFKEDVTAVLPNAIAAVPNAYTLAVAGTATANIIAIMPEMYSNVQLAPGGTLTFASSAAAKASVVAGTGVITGVAAGDAVITATYTPVAGTTLKATIAVTVQ